MKQIALFFLLLFSSLLAQENNPDTFSFIQQLYFENSQHQFDPYLLEEIPALLESAAPNEQTEELLWMLASTEEWNGLKYKALLNYYKILFLYPQSKFKEESIDKIRTCIGVCELSDSLYHFLDKTTGYIDTQEGDFAFISFIYQANSDSLTAVLVDEIDLFVKIYPASMYEDILLFWKGKLRAKQNQPFYAEAIFRRILYQYPKSTLRADVLLALADIYWHQIGNLNRATEIFYELINSFPENKYGGNAQFYLSELLADSLKNQTESNNNYRLFCQNYPEHPFVARAWKRMGDAALKGKNLLEARNYYQQSYERAKDDSLISGVLQKMEAISFELKDYKNAAQILLVEAKNENSAKKMLRAAKLYREILNDKAEAKKILLRIIENFPGTSAAQEAERAVRQ